VQGKEDLLVKYVMPVSEKNRRKEGAPCMVANLKEFEKNWNIFTGGLSLNWSIGIMLSQLEDLFWPA